MDTLPANLTQASPQKGSICSIVAYKDDARHSGGTTLSQESEFEKVRAPEQKELVELTSAVELAERGITATSKSFLQGATLLKEASKEFAENPPGRRASQLGFMLVVFSVAGEVIEVIFPATEFRDSTLLAMLGFGVLLVIVAGGLDTYFTLKVTQILEAEAESMEEEAADLKKNAAEKRSKARRLLTRFSGAE